MNVIEFVNTVSRHATNVNPYNIYQDVLIYCRTFPNADLSRESLEDWICFENDCAAFTAARNEEQKKRSRLFR